MVFVNIIFYFFNHHTLKNHSVDASGLEVNILFKKDLKMNKKKRIIAVGLLSGGLDSTLTAKLMLEQNIDIYAVNFHFPFCTCTPKKAGCEAIVTALKELGDIPILKIGRHFRLENGDKVVVARNEQESRALKHLSRETNHLIEPQGFVGPTVVLQGQTINKAVEKMLAYTKRPVSEEAKIRHTYEGKTIIKYIGEIC